MTYQDGAQMGGNPQKADEAASLSNSSFHAEQAKHRGGSILKGISGAEDVETYRRLNWRGSFSEYLDKVIANPTIAASAIQRVHNMILADGVEPREVDGVKVNHYKFFDDPRNGGREAIFGLDPYLDQFTRVLEAGANKLGMEKRIILLVGPVGSAKSTIARLLKQGLEQYSHTEEGAVYGIGWKKALEKPSDWDKQNQGRAWDPSADENIEWSPMNEDPLTAIPKEKREEFLALLNKGIKQSDPEARPVNINGGLSPLSRARFNELMQQYDGDLARALEHVVVRRVVVSEEDRVGIGTFQPKDPKSQDSTELTGDMNYRKIAQSGKDSDPRAFNFDGEFCIANRGIIEFQEAIKLDLTFLYELLGASQEKVVKPKKFQQIEIDELIIAHTNRPEFEKLRQNPYMEALRDRIVKVDVPYVTTLDDEVRVYEKDFNKNRVYGHFIAPHTIEVASMLAVLSRIGDAKDSTISLIDKMHLYNGRGSWSGGYSDKAVQDIRRKASSDGLDGISPRFIQESLNECLVQAGEGKCISPYLLFKVLEQKIDESTRLNPEQKKKTAELLALVREEHKEIVKSEVQRAVAYDRDVLDKLYQNYVSNVDAAIRKDKVTDSLTGQRIDPDEKFMQSVEERMGITNTMGRSEFRSSLMNSIASATVVNRTFDWTTNRKLFDALSQKLFDDNKDQLNLRAFVSRTMDPKTREKIDVLKDTLIKNFGYDDESAEQVIAHVASIFAR